VDLAIIICYVGHV